MALALVLSAQLAPIETLPVCAHVTVAGNEMSSTVAGVVPPDPLNRSVMRVVIISNPLKR